MNNKEIEMRAIEKYKDLILSLMDAGLPAKEAINIAFYQMQMEEKEI